MIPPIPYISPGPDYGMDTKYRVFRQAGAGIYGMVSIFPLESGFCIADAEVIKHIASTRSVFKKHLEDYGILQTFGNHLLVAEGEEWKKQRRICAPAFSDKNNRLVWTTTINFIDKIINTWPTDETVRIRDVCKDLTLPLALCVIAKAGFGRDVPWTDEAPPPAGHTFTFKQSLSTFSENQMLPLVMPAWGWRLRKHWRHVKQANDELLMYIREMVKLRRESTDGLALPTAVQTHDLFSQLVEARDSNEMLTEDELVANVLLFMIAGHETTGHTLAIMLGLLALYPEEQGRVVDQIKELHDDEANLTYDDMRKLTYAMAVMYETLRLYPMVPIVIRRPVSDTTLTVGCPPEHVQIHNVSTSTRTFIFASGIHYNPMYWDDPEEFLPGRFMDVNWNRDAFIPFLVGPRACIGRRFAETMVIAALLKLVPKYSVSVDETRFKPIPGESILDRRQRFLNPKTKLSLTPAALPLVFTPRA
ncbi:cytochrome P450 [Ceratobasidium sp. AG-I]|nr:cytochrome P450 [Ceratobasidium sp. AG-I]